MTKSWDALQAHLRRLTESGAYLAAGVARADADGVTVSLTGVRRPGDRPGDLSGWADARMRVASISKAVTARVLATLVAEGKVSLDDALHDILCPHGYPEWLAARPITLAQLLSHRSGLTDHAGYFTDPPDDLPAFLTRHAEAITADWAPGARFFYANLNYVLAGAVIEAVIGDRFDRAARDRVLAPLGIAGGFNWAGVPDRDRRLPMYQRRGDAYSLEADGDDAKWTADLIWRGGAGLSLQAYRPVRDTHLFSPHAGLRLSFAEMALLARALGDDSAEACLSRSTQWRWDGHSDEGCDGLFPEVGLGLTTYKDHDRIPGYLVGHAGHALGFTGGVWCDMKTSTGWAYALTGSPDLTDGIDTEMFYPPEELMILQSFGG